VQEYEKRLTELKALARDIMYRHEQARERPRAIEAMTQILNHSNMFLSTMRNLTGDLQIFTDVEMNLLETKINETIVCDGIFVFFIYFLLQAWWKEKQEAQKKLKGSDDPAYTLSQVGEKVCF
jgi:hypothetical protein